MRSRKGGLTKASPSRDRRERASSLLGTRRACGPQGCAVLDRLLDAGDRCEHEDDFELPCQPGTPSLWRPLKRHIPPPTCKSARRNAPDFPPAAMGKSIPQASQLGKEIPELVAPQKAFSSGRRNSAKQGVLFQRLRGVQPDIQNSTELMAEISWLFFDPKDEDSRLTQRSEIRGWAVYDGVWARDEPRFLRSTQFVRGHFRDCIVAVLRTNRRRNIWRSAKQNRRPRVEFLPDLRGKLGGHTSVQQPLGEARPGSHDSAVAECCCRPRTELSQRQQSFRLHLENVADPSTVGSLWSAGMPRGMRRQLRRAQVGAGSFADHLQEGRDLRTSCARSRGRPWLAGCDQL